MNADKTDVRVALTPAEQMMMIRNAVIGEGSELAAATGIEKLASFLQSPDRTQQRLHDLESRAWIRETVFQSQAPVIAKAIVAIRNLWNWMSTKWYVLPMLQQQNSFNVAAAQMVRELWTVNRSQFAAICQLEERINALENALGQSKVSRSADDQ